MVEKAIAEQSEAKKEAVVKRCTQEKAKEYKAALIAAEKSYTTNKIMLYQAIFECQANEIWFHFGCADLMTFIQKTFPNERLGSSTVREAIRVWSQMSAQLEAEFGYKDDKLITETRKQLDRYLVASGGQMRRVSEVTRYDTAKNPALAVAEIAAAESVNDLKVRLAKKFKPLNPGKVAGEAGKRAMGVEGATYQQMILSFEVTPTNDYGVIIEALNVAAKMLGVPVPAEEMSGSDRAKCLAAIAVQFVGDNPDAAVMVTEKGRNEMAKIDIRNAIVRLSGRDPGGDIIKKCFVAISGVLEREADEAEQAERDGDDEEHEVA